MTHSSYFFTGTLGLSNIIAEHAHKRKWGLKELSVLTAALGLLSPVPLILFYWIPQSPFRWLGFVVFASFILMDSALFHLEILYRKKSPYNSFIPFPPAVLFFVWYELFFFEVMYWLMGLQFIRYINVFSLCCVVASLFLIYGYLKVNELPLNIHRLVERLEALGESNEKDAPLNYITLTFTVLKKDLLSILFVVLGVINIYLLYLVMSLGSVFILVFTLYSLFILKVYGKRKNP